MDIAHNLDLTTLEIITSSDPGSGDRIAVEFLDQTNSQIGRFFIIFEQDIKLTVQGCFESMTFDEVNASELPIENIWRISKFASKQIFTF